MSSTLLFVFDMLAALASVVVILGWLGITPQHFKVNWSMREVNVSTRKLYLVLALTSVSLVLSAVGLYFSFHPDPLHYKNKRFTETIQDRVYTNERVELDGKMYEHCTFNNVTFVFHGTGPVGFRNNVFSGSKMISTDNDAVTSTLILLKGLRFMREDVPLLEGPEAKEKKFE